MPPVPVVPPEVVVPPEALPPVPMVVPPLEQPTASRSAIAGPRTELNDDTVRSTDDDVMSTPLNVRCGKHQNRTPRSQQDQGPHLYSGVASRVSIRQSKQLSFAQRPSAGWYAVRARMLLTLNAKLPARRACARNTVRGIPRQRSPVPAIFRVIDKLLSKCI